MTFEESINSLGANEAREQLLLKAPQLPPVVLRKGLPSELDKAHHMSTGGYMKILSLIGSFSRMRLYR